MDLSRITDNKLRTIWSNLPVLAARIPSKFLHEAIVKRDLEAVLEELDAIIGGRMTFSASGDDQRTIMLLANVVREFIQGVVEYDR